MRVLFPTLLLALGGCAGELPGHRSDMAWVDLSAQPGAVFMADRLNGEVTPDGRYFQLSPGGHELRARYDFEIGRAGFGEREFLRCSLVVRYDDFQPGQRYLFEARALGYQPQAWLYDQQRRQVAEAQVAHCH